MKNVDKTQKKEAKKSKKKKVWYLQTKKVEKE